MANPNSVPSRWAHLSGFALLTPTYALDRLGLRPDRWTTHVHAVGSGYWRAIGATQALLVKASAMGQHWRKGIALARTLGAA